MKIRLLQFDSAMRDRVANFQTVVDLFAESAGESQATDVFVLPELWDIGCLPTPTRDYAAPDAREGRAFLADLARKHGVNIVGGSLARLDGERVYNTSYVFDRSGREIAAYDKVHLFSPTGEPEHFAAGAGRELAVFSLDGHKAGVATCYDVRFCEWVRKYALAGAELLFLPAAWPVARLGHWRLLNMARAVENQFFVAAVNQTGKAGHLQYAGHSLLVDPWGEVVAEGGSGPESVAGVVDFAAVRDIRAKMNIFRDRRPELYG